MSETNISMQQYYETKVKDVMQTVKSTDACVEETADITSVLFHLKTKDHVWVMRKSDPLQVSGVITESDTLVLFSPPIVSLQTFDKPDSRSLQYGVALTAEEIMSKNPVETYPDETLRDVITKMKQHHVKYLPVVDQNGLLQGEITLQRLINHYTKKK